MNQIKDLSRNNLPLLILPVVYICLFWPGFMSDDSLAVLQQSKYWSFSEHHPPLMAVFWGFVNHIYPGPGLMLLFNLILLWLAVLFAYKIFKNSKWRYYFLLMPFFPQIIIYAGFIWKDIIFAFGFICISMILAERTLSKKNLPWPALIVVILLLFYAASVKYQAKFIAPLIVLWMIIVQTRQYLPKDWTWKIPVYAVAASILLISSINLTNNMLIGNNYSYSWQFVKIYDLAGISIISKNNVMPDFLFKTHNLSSKNKLNVIEQKFDILWEPLIVYPDSPLRPTSTAAERDNLLHVWRMAVLQNPGSYLKHRTRVIITTLTRSPLNNMFNNNYGDRSWAKIALFIGQLTILLPLLPVLFGIAVLSLHRVRITRLAWTSLILSFMGLMLVAILFIMSLASTPRYVFFTQCCFWFSLPFAWNIINSKNIEIENE